MRGSCSRRRSASDPAAYQTLSTKALQLTGGPGSPPPPPDRNVYGVLIASGDADIFLTYCTNALAAQKEEPALQLVPIPDALAVGADYGLTVLEGASAPAREFARFVLSAPRTGDSRPPRFHPHRIPVNGDRHENQRA